MKIRSAYIGLALLALVSLAFARQQSKKLAVVNGEVITEEEVSRAVASDLAKLETKKPASEAAYRRERLAILWKGLNEILQNKLLTIEAGHNSMTKDQLVQVQVDDNIQGPMDNIVEAFYDANKSRLPFSRTLPRAEALAKTREYMIAQTRKHAMDSYIASLMKEDKVETYLDPLRAQIATAGYPARGAANAPITIVEFSDFECPYCKALEPTLAMILKNYPEKVRLVYRQFPLTYVHPHAEKAAEASLCAESQRHFWEFHDSMFGDQQHLSVDDLKKRAADMKLDTAAFDSCLDSGSRAAAVSRDIDEGFRAGVSGTPTFFINGRMMYGNQPYSEIRAVIEDELRRVSH